MAKKEILENNENQLTKEEKYQLAKECFEKEDYEQAVSFYEQAAKLDCADAEYELAQLYQAGVGVAKDEKKAAYYFELAAMLEHAEAQNAIGDCFYYGQGVPRNYKKAVYWYRQAANKGHE